MSNSTIKIQLVDISGTITHFRIKSSTTFAKIKTAHALRTGDKVESIRFIYDGELVSDSDTPGTLCVEDGDTIDVSIVAAKKKTSTSSTKSSARTSGKAIPPGTTFSKRKASAMGDDDELAPEAQVIDIGDEDDEPAVAVKLETADGKQTDFKLKMTKDCFGSIKTALSRQLGKPSETIFLVYNGRKVDDNATPYDVDFEPGSAVLAVVASKKLRTK